MILASRCPSEVQPTVSGGKLQRIYKTCMTTWGSGSGRRWQWDTRQHCTDMVKPLLVRKIPTKTWLLFAWHWRIWSSTFECCLQKLSCWQWWRLKSSISTQRNQTTGLCLRNLTVATMGQSRRQCGLVSFSNTNHFSKVSNSISGKTSQALGIRSLKGIPKAEITSAPPTLSAKNHPNLLKCI